MSAEAASIFRRHESASSSNVCKHIDVEPTFRNDFKNDLNNVSAGNLNTQKIKFSRQCVAFSVNMY